MRRFYWCDPIAKNALVDVCLHGMVNRLYLEIFFLSFSRLMEAARHKFVWKTLKSSSLIRYVSKKRPIIPIVENNKGAKVSSLKKFLTIEVPYPSTFSLKAKKVVALLE